MNKSEILSVVEKYTKELIEKEKFILESSYINPSGPQIDSKDFVTLVGAVLDGWFTESKYARMFGAEIERYTDKKYVNLCNSGSSASLLASLATTTKHQNVKKMVLTTALGFPTTVSAIYQVGKYPYYIDIDPKTLSPKLDDLEHIMNHHVSEDVCGAIFTHTLGFPFDEKRIKEMLKPDMWFVADCCDAFGAELLFEKPVPVGYYADITTLSFFPAHHITSGEGGAVCTNDPKLNELVRSYANWGRSCYCLPGQQNVCGKRFNWKPNGNMPDGWDHKYIFDRLGYNLKMTELQAALGYSQIQRLSKFNLDRTIRFYNFKTRLPSRWIETVDVPEWSKPAPFGFPVIVKKGAPFSTNDLIKFLESKKIGTRRMFGGNLIRQPGFMNLPYRKTDLAGTDFVMNNMFWFGVHPSITNEMSEYILDAFKEFFNDKG